MSNILNLYNESHLLQLYLDIFDGNTIEISTTITKPGYYSFELCNYNYHRVSGDSHGYINVIFPDSSNISKSIDIDSGAVVSIGKSLILGYGKTTMMTYSPKRFIMRLENPQIIRIAGSLALGTNVVGNVLLSFNVQKISDL